MAAPLKKALFCAACQKDTQQSFTVENGELIARCDCGRFAKFPGDMDAAALKTAFAKHKADSAGQVVAPDPAQHPIWKELGKI